MQQTNLTFNLAENTIHATVAASGHETALIMWCGLGSTSQSFLHLIEDGLANQVDVIAIDPPGHGESAEWNGDFTPADAASIWAALVEYAKQRDARRIFVGGHSYGAFTALMALPEVEDDIAGVVLLDGGYVDYGAIYNREEAIAGAKAYLETQRFSSWDEYLNAERNHVPNWDKLIETMLCSNMKEVNGQIVPKVSLEAGTQAQDLLAYFRLDEVPVSRLPVLLVRATEPDALREDREQGTARLQRRLPNLSVVEVHGEHNLVVDNPQDTARAVWAFIHSN